MIKLHLSKVFADADNDWLLPRLFHKPTLPYPYENVPERESFTCSIKITDVYINDYNNK